MLIPENVIDSAAALLYERRMCMCGHVHNYVTYHQRKSSKHHDQQNDHRSYQHLGGCREKQSGAKKMIIHNEYMFLRQGEMEIAQFKFNSLFSYIMFKY